MKTYQFREKTRPKVSEWAESGYQLCSYLDLQSRSICPNYSPVPWRQLWIHQTEAEPSNMGSCVYRPGLETHTPLIFKAFAFLAGLCTHIYFLLNRVSLINNNASSTIYVLTPLWYSLSRTLRTGHGPYSSVDAKVNSYHHGLIKGM